MSPAEWSSKATLEAQMGLKVTIETTDGKKFISDPRWEENGKQEKEQKKRDRNSHAIRDAVEHQKTLNMRGLR